MQMQPNTQPIAKCLKKIKSNLANPTDQLKMYRNIYINHLNNELKVEPKTRMGLMKLFDQFIDRDSMPTIFPLHITIFHKAFIQKLENL